MEIFFYLFNDFETLDLFGPVEILCRIPGLVPHYISRKGGKIKSAQNTVIETESADLYCNDNIFVIPGGRGTRPLVNDEEELSVIKEMGGKSRYCLSICTGSAVLAKCGLLDGKKATSNKKAFDWACSFGTDVKWERKPRFCKDGKYYTSAGVSAGMDMAFEFVKDYSGEELAKKIAEDIEYEKI